jgi:hypothetical protein
VQVEVSINLIETNEARVLELGENVREILDKAPSARTFEESMDLDEYESLKEEVEYSKSVLFNNPCNVHHAIPPAVDDNGFGPDLSEELDENSYNKYKTNAPCRKHLDNEDDSR